MRFKSRGKWWTCAVLALLVVLTTVTVRALYRALKLRQLLAGRKDPTFFTDDFPYHEAFRTELHQLRMQARLAPENEQAILGGVQKTAQLLSMPPAVLWCLLFQESRLDHLAGHDEKGGAVGLGQFSHFSFYEVNHHLTKFSERNLSTMTEVLGRDVRPISPTYSNVPADSSYYSIPTAVISSATYLNNRYLHLGSILDKHRISYDDKILWLYATLAYNKGTRSILSFWNTVHRRKGLAAVQKSLLDIRSLSQLIENQKLVKESFRKIWTPAEANAYAAEWLIHFRNTSLCAVKPEAGTTTAKAVSRGK